MPRIQKGSRIVTPYEAEVLSALEAMRTGDPDRFSVVMMLFSVTAALPRRSEARASALLSEIADRVPWMLEAPGIVEAIENLAPEVA